MNTTPPTRCDAWKLLAARAAGTRTKRESLIAQAPGVRFDFSRQNLDASIVRLLVQLARERGLAGWRKALYAGQPVNPSEGRAAWHTALRAGDAAPAEVKQTLQKMKHLSRTTRRDKKIRRVVNLGAGGSDLGPRLVADALGDRALEVRFAASADPLDLERALEGAEPASTLFVVVSKSFATPETLANAGAARRWSGNRKNFVAVTANPQKALPFDPREILPMWNWVGGRFSVWSAAGFAAMCAIGAESFEEFLAGGREIDAHFLETPLANNIPALMALVGVWNVNFRGAATHAVLPYAHALRLLPAYLQQLEMESNGKRVDREGRPVKYATAPVVWGAEGTPSQHSFHQLLLEGTQVVPVDFIELNLDQELSANAKAQADALALGGRPSSTLHFDGLNPRNLGRLISLYEHKVFTQGVVWNLNSFDQPGVELGKRLARQILSRRR